MPARRILIAFLLLLACPWSTELAYAQARHRVGVIAPLTGPGAPYGAAIRHGIELASSDFPDRFKTIEFVFEDDQLSGRSVAGAFEKLRQKDGARVVLGFGVATGNIVAPIAQSTRTVFLNLGIEPGPAFGRPFVIRTMNPAEEYMHALLKYLRGRGLKKFTIVHAQVPFLNTMIQAFRKNMLPGESIESAGTFSPIERDFKGVIAKLSAAGLKDLGVFLLPEQIDAFYRQSRDQQFRFAGYGTDLFEAAMQLGDPAQYEGVLYADNDVNERFRLRYAERFGSDGPITSAGNAYDIAIMTAAAFGSLASFEPERLLEAIKRGAVGEGVMGSYLFKEDRVIGRYFALPLFVKQVRNGTGVRVGRG